MIRWMIAALLGGCAARSMPSAVAPSGSDSAYCPMVLATVKSIVRPPGDDSYAMEEACVQEFAVAHGITHAEAVAFDPMPVTTVTCKDDGWIVQIGQTPPRARTEAVVLVGFVEKRGDVRRFWARVERANWREQPNRSTRYLCGSVEGSVRREGAKWVAKTQPEEDH